jgi:RNA polymerase sigma factor (sigma-70 family)
MTESDWLTQRFQEHRPRLRAVAYRMLGSTSEADDALQEAWLRASRSDASGADNLGAWLTTIVARVCLNMLRSRKSHREEPLDAQHLPDPIVERPEEGIDPEHEALLADGVGLALLVVLETLTPPERLAYVLHDMFSVPFEQIGAILERSPEAARQLASRARRRIRTAHTTPHHHADVAAHHEEQQEVVEAFLAAARDGDFEALLAVLDPNIVERVDTGSGTILEVRGAHNVARRAMAAASQGDGLVGRPALVNGAAGWVSVLDAELYAIAALTVHNGRITTMDILLDRARLARFDLTEFFDSQDYESGLSYELGVESSKIGRAK